MSKAERDARTGLEKREAERSKRKEDRHDAHPKDEIKHAGSLVQQGYRVEEGQDKRRTALNAAVHKHGYEEVLQKLDELVTMNKHHEENSRRLQDDLGYLKSHLKSSG